MKKDRVEPKLSTIMVFSCLVIFSLITFLLTPIYIYIASDIVTGVTILPDAVKIVLNLFEIAAFAIGYSLIIFSSVTYTKAKTLSLCAIYVAACFVRRAASLAVTRIVDGYIVSSDIFSVLLYFILEVIQVFIVYFIAMFVAKKYFLNSTGTKKAAAKNGGLIGIINDRRFDFIQVYSSSNPLQCSSLRCGIMLAAVKLLTRVAYDIDYGAPQDLSDGLTMAIYYLADVFICIIFYALSWLILSRLVKKQSTIKDLQE